VGLPSHASEVLLESGRGVVRLFIGPIYFLASGERKEVLPYQESIGSFCLPLACPFWKEKQPMAHHRLSHPKTERDYHLRFNQLKQAITTLKSQIEQETALIQDFKGPANILLALVAGHHRRQSLSEIAQARQRLIRLQRELAELQAEEQTLTQEWESRKDQLRQAAELAAKDEALQQGFKQVRLEEQRLELEKKEAAMKKQLRKKQLLEEQELLEKQTAETNKRMVEVRRQLKEYEEDK
jgi:hypothetical protein